jgi:hypothetical protein
MACAHAFGEWCRECISGLMTQYNKVTAENYAITQKLDAVTRQRDDYVSRYSAMVQTQVERDDKMHSLELQLSAIHDIVDGLSCAHEFGKKCLTCDIKAAFAEKRVEANFPAPGCPDCNGYNGNHADSCKR